MQKNRSRFQICIAEPTVANNPAGRLSSLGNLQWRLESVITSKLPQKACLIVFPFSLCTLPWGAWTSHDFLWMRTVKKEERNLRISQRKQGLSFGFGFLIVSTLRWKQKTFSILMPTKNNILFSRLNERIEWVRDTRTKLQCEGLSDGKIVYYPFSQDFIVQGNKNVLLCHNCEINSATWCILLGIVALSSWTQPDSWR